MYYTELDPRNMKPVYVPKNPHEKAMQRALIQYRNPNNYELVLEALRKAGREDLIGFDKSCLVRPRRLANQKSYKPLETKSKKSSDEKRTFTKKTNYSKTNIPKSATTNTKTQSSHDNKKKMIRNVHKKK